MITLVHNKTGEEVQGTQYLQGAHPPPQGVTVTMGLRGVIARVATVNGPNQRINHTDWLLTLPGVGLVISTDTFVRKMYAVEGADTPSEPDKPVNLG